MRTDSTGSASLPSRRSGWLLKRGGRNGAALHCAPFLPDEAPNQIALSQEHRGFLTEVRIAKDGNLVGKPVGEVPFLKRANVKLVGLKRGATLRRTGLADEILEAGDPLVLRLELAELLSLRENKNVVIGLTAGHDDIAHDSEEIVEAMIAPSHPAIGRRLIEIPFLSALRVRILGVARFRKTPGPDLPNARIQAVDRVLVTGPADQIEQMYANPHLYGVGSTTEREFRRSKAPLAIRRAARGRAARRFQRHGHRRCRDHRCRLYPGHTLYRRRRGVGFDRRQCAGVDLRHARGRAGAGKFGQRRPRCRRVDTAASRRSALGVGRRNLCCRRFVDRNHHQQRRGNPGDPLVIALARELVSIPIRW